MADESAEELVQRTLPEGTPRLRGEGGDMARDAAGRNLIRRCRQLRRMADKRVKDEKLQEEYDKIAKFYQSDRKATGHLIVTVNQLYPTVRLGMSGLATKVPEFLAVSRDPAGGGAVNAANMTAAMNFNAEQERFSPEVRDALIHSLTCHYAAVKYGATPEGLMWLESVHPLSVRTDPTLERFDPPRGRFLSHAFAKSVSSMRESGRYPESSLSAILGAARREARADLAEDAVMVILTENYVWQGRELLLATEASGFDVPVRPVEVLDPAIYPEIPFEFLFFAHKLKGYFPIAEPMLYMDQMEETEKLRSKALVHASRANVRIILNSKMIKRPEGDAAAKGDPWVLVYADGDVDKAAKVLDPANMSHAIYREQELAAAQDIWMITGYGSGPREQPSTPSSPATKFAIDQQNMLARQTDREQQTREWITRIGRNMGRILQHRLAIPLAQKISGRADAIRVNGPGDLAGEFDYKYFAYNAYTKDPAVVRREATELYTALLSNPLVNQVKNLTQYLEAYNRNDLLEWFNPIALQQLAPWAVMPDAGMPPDMLDMLAGPGPGAELSAPDTGLQVDTTGTAQGLPPLDFAEMAMGMV